MELSHDQVTIFHAVQLTALSLLITKHKYQFKLVLSSKNKFQVIDSNCECS